MKTLLLAAMAILTAFTASCVVRNKPYRINNPITTASCDESKKGYRVNIPAADTSPDPPLAFIEFDDMGELWDRERCKSLNTEGSCQLKEALDLIDKHKRTSERLVVITFIHGWKNNASEGNKNVERFKCFLKEMQLKGPPASYVGVYLGWRGKLTADPITSALSFWNRRQAAMRVATVSMTEAILRLMHRTKETNESPDRFIILGHSFGGLILERAMAQALTGWITTGIRDQPCEADQGKNCFVTPADLVVLINPALESIETQQLIDMLRRQNITTEGGQPLLVSITAQNDWATGKVLPLGHFLESVGKNFRRRPPNDPDCETEVPSQWKLYTHTAGHLSYFFSHYVSKTPCDEKVLTYSTATKGRYYVCEKKRACNKTPYWIMKVDKEIINGHNGIWNEGLRELLITLLGDTASGRMKVLKYEKF